MAGYTVGRILRASNAKGPGEEQRGVDETGKGFHARVMDFFDLWRLY
jgi:hypothetical protein